jgi:copper chaperone CopZ
LERLLTKTVILVTGMRDNCVREKITEALEEVDGVVQADVNLFRAQAVVLHRPPCAPVDLVRAVIRVGCRAEVEQTER